MSETNYVVLGGWRGVVRFVTKDKLGHWELDYLPVATRFTKDEADQVARLIHGVAVTYEAAKEL